MQEASFRDRRKEVGVIEVRTKLHKSVVSAREGPKTCIRNENRLKISKNQKTWSRLLVVIPMQADRISNYYFVLCDAKYSFFLRMSTTFFSESPKKMPAAVALRAFESVRFRSVTERWSTGCIARHQKGIRSATGKYLFLQ